MSKIKEVPKHIKEKCKRLEELCIKKKTSHPLLL